jgi:hypothetical protein
MKPTPAGSLKSLCCFHGLMKPAHDAQARNEHAVAALVKTSEWQEGESTAQMAQHAEQVRAVAEEAAAAHAQLTARLQVCCLHYACTSCETWKLFNDSGTSNWQSVTISTALIAVIHLIQWAQYIESKDTC